MTDGGSKDDNSPCGVGALQAGVFWLLEEKILHKGRSGVNRGDRKIFGGKRRMSPDRFCLIRATASYGLLSSVACVERHRRHDVTSMNQHNTNIIKTNNSLGHLF